MVWFQRLITNRHEQCNTKNARTYLEGNEREGEAGVAVEEEDHGKVETLDTTGINTSIAGIEVSETLISRLLVIGAEELVVDSVEIRVDAINSLATNFELHIRDKLFGGVVGMGSTLLLEGDF